MKDYESLTVIRLKKKYSEVNPACFKGLRKVIKCNVTLLQYWNSYTTYYILKRVICNL